MKRINTLGISVFRYIGISVVFGLLSLSEAVFVPALAQSDSTLNRSVTVERDFQPVIQAAGKVSTKPEVIETTIDPAPVDYSEYTAELAPGSAFNPLLSQPTRFEPGKPYHGYLRGAIGHPNTLFDFGYHLNDGKNSILDVYAHHKAEWGLAALSKTKIGLDFTHTYSTCDLYFGLNGGNIYYHKYGHWYDYSQPWNMWAKNKEAYSNYQSPLAKDLTSLWTAEAFFGVKANAKQDFQYKLQTGYMLFAKPGAVAEHQIRTHASFDWHSEAHHVGAVLYVQNNFLQLRSLADVIPDSLYNGRHNFRVEPYYAYHGRRLRLHLGVNLDLNLGRGKNSLSGVENLSFAPSPHINLEAQVAREWLTIYADITGSHGLGSLQSYMESNRYRLIHPGIVSHHSCSYTPVDGELGFHIRPLHNLLLELHGGYALQFDQMTLIANTDNQSVYNGVKYQPPVAMEAGDFAYTYSDYSRGKVGGQINYHFRDAVRINIYGDYYFWSALRHEKIGYTFTSPCAEIDAINAGTNNTVYDRANWQIGCRIDGRIDRHWSLYSDNRFEGSRLALAKDGEHTLKPVIDLDLGLQYDMWVGKKNDKIVNDKMANGTVLRPEPKPNLSLFLQVNNWLHRKNEYYYGYRSQGINCLIGVTYRF